MPAIALMLIDRLGLIVPGIGPFEQGVYLGVADRPVALVGNEILFRYIGDVLAFFVFCEQMIEGLVLFGPDLLRNRIPPFIGVRIFRVDVEDDAAEREHPMANHLSDLKFGVSLFHDATHPFRQLSGLSHMEHQEGSAPRQRASIGID
ncbi:hypothetical protein EMEDMD4_160063 [Sinorhizobium medicae]|uniref:Uncharacterized protein n=1 Tax=Sinorhizobium medicae TaxID=110321 RepID=A0A508WSM4_9HYPH|nr:hypothetical protein EMEDMD4_160063 [Sinorhizobium medicae]